MLYKLYVISAGNDSMKIGIAKNPHKRLKNMQTGNHRRLTIDAIYNIGSYAQAYDIEHKVHDFLKKRGAHISGEWFQYKPCLVFRTIKNVASWCKQEQKIRIDSEPYLPDGAQEHMSSLH